MSKFQHSRPVRSNAYQYLICEVSASDEFLASFSNNQSIDSHLNPFQYNERYLQLEQQLRDKTWQLAKQICTARQWQIMEMYMTGMTQGEIAKALNCNQSSITKSIHGNIDYTAHRKQARKVYGGSIKKIKKYVEEDAEIKAILEEMDLILQEKL